MRSISRVLLFLFTGSALISVQPVVHGQGADGTVVQTAAEQLMVMANQVRQQNGAGPLHWDSALAAAALKHCRRMAAEGPISHRYTGEADVAARAGQAGAHFSVIEENVAVGPSAVRIHEGWMQSPGHRENLLSPEVDRVGIAVVASRGVLYAVADYSRGVESVSVREAESKIASLVRHSGVAVSSDSSIARQACAMDSGFPNEVTERPGFIIRWQDSQLDQLPKSLANKLASGQYHRAAIGSCSAQGVQGTFTAYRFAVLLY